MSFQSWSDDHNKEQQENPDGKVISHFQDVKATQPQDEEVAQPVMPPVREKTLDELIAEEEAKERDEFDERKNWFNQR